MIFDSFIIQNNALPPAILKKYNCRTDSVFIFTDEPINTNDIYLTDGQLSVMGDKFSYSFMSHITREATPNAEVYIHNLSKSLWNAQVKAYLSLYKSNIDRQAILDECKNLPFVNDESAIDFFIEEVTFSKSGGVIPIGLCLLDLSTNEMHSQLSIIEKITLWR